MALGVETKPEASRPNGTLMCDKVSRKHSRKDKKERVSVNKVNYLALETGVLKAQHMDYGVTLKRGRHGKHTPLAAVRSLNETP